MFFFSEITAGFSPSFPLHIPIGLQKFLQEFLIGSLSVIAQDHSQEISLELHQLVFFSLRLRFFVVNLQGCLLDLFLCFFFPEIDQKIPFKEFYSSSRYSLRDSFTKFDSFRNFFSGSFRNSASIFFQDFFRKSSEHFFRIAQQTFVYLSFQKLYRKFN